MILSYENLLTITDFNFKPNQDLLSFNIYTFLSFQDALHYLIKNYQWQNKTILIPAFYCDATLHDMVKQGLKVRLCKIDHKNFDINVQDFKQILQNEKPDIILIYNFFGKNSILYTDLSWKKLISPNTILISDFAHSLIPNHQIQFLNPQHFYIDSTRKTTSCMLANLIMPVDVKINAEHLVKYAKFKLAIRSLFFLKSWCLRFATLLNQQHLAQVGLWLYGLHDHYIGSRNEAYTSFGWDSFLYRRIKFDKIREHRKKLQNIYQKELASLANQHIELFPLTEQEAGNVCFFFLRILNSNATLSAIACLNRNGIWAEVLWNFDAIPAMTEVDKTWAKSLIVLPYTIHTKEKHIKQISELLKQFFSTYKDG